LGKSGIKGLVGKRSVTGKRFEKNYSKILLGRKMPTETPGKGKVEATGSGRGASKRGRVNDLKVLEEGPT